MEVTCDVRGRAVSLKCKKEIGLRRPLEVNSRSSLMFFVFTKRIGGIALVTRGVRGGVVFGA